MARTSAVGGPVTSSGPRVAGARVDSLESPLAHLISNGVPLEDRLARVAVCGIGEGRQPRHQPVTGPGFLVKKITRSSSGTAARSTWQAFSRAALALAHPALAGLSMTLWSLLFGASMAAAQPTDSAAAADPEGAPAGGRQAAAEAYDRGTAAYLRADYERAAGWFETAHRLSPAAPALIQAVRAHMRAGQLPRALTLALRLRERYPDDRRATDLANELLHEHTGDFVHVTIDCDGCQVDLDGKLQASKAFFIEPGTEREVTAIFSGAELTEVVSGEADQQLTLRFDTPPSPEPLAEAAGAPDPRDLTAAPPARRDQAGLPPLLVYVGAVATVGLGAATVASGINANQLGNEFDEAVETFSAVGCDRDGAPATSCERLDEVVGDRFDRASDAELRTNILLGAAIGAGVLTGVLALVVQWDDEGDDRAGGAPSNAAVSNVTLSAAPLPDGAMATVGGAF